jgi:hypothetical protein
MIKLDIHCGRTFEGVVTEAIQLAADTDDTVEFEFNGVPVIVGADSIPELIERDLYRAFLRGDKCSEFVVGPHPNDTLTAEELDEDNRLKAALAEQQRQREERWTAENRAKKELLRGALIVAPAMEFKDRDLWDEAVAKNTDSYGKGVREFAERWARLMQAQLAAGKPLTGCAEETSHVADVDGITGFMYGCAVQILSQAWVYGDDLRKWHNKEYGVDEDAEGVVNPAVLVINA